MSKSQNCCPNFHQLYLLTNMLISSKSEQLQFVGFYYLQSQRHLLYQIKQCIFVKSKTKTEKKKNENKIF